MKSRAESLDSDLDLLRAAFSEISRLATEVSTEPTEEEKKDWPLTNIAGLIGYPTRSVLENSLQNTRNDFFF